MASTNWRIGLDGDWSAPGNWTNGVPTSSTDVQIRAAGAFTVTLSTAGTAHSLLFNSVDGTFLETASASLTLTTELFIEAGRAILNGANTIGGSAGVQAAVIEVGNSHALGAAVLTLTNSELVGLADLTLSNSITFEDNDTIAAASGTALTLPGAFQLADQGTVVHLTFGDDTNDGTVIWRSANATLPSGGHYTVEVADGTLAAGDTQFSSVFIHSDDQTIVDSGATLDLAGFALEIDNLSGGGTIGDSGSAAQLTLGNATFTGAIEGAIALSVSGATVLTGTNIYIGGTTIDGTGVLTLGDGGTTGTVAGAIVDSGSLVFHRTGVYSVASAISGTGTVVYEGGGVVTVNRAEQYSGGTQIVGSELSIGNPDALGTGAFSFQDSELLATQTMTVHTSLEEFEGASTIAAAHSRTLTLGANVDFGGSTNSPSVLTFGEGANDGTVVVGSAASRNINDRVFVQSGTLKAGDNGGLAFLLTAGVTTVEAGAKLVWAGFSGAIGDLRGDGSVTNVGGAGIELFGADFAGVISGAAALEIAGPVILSGANTYTAGTTIDVNGTLCLGHGGTTGSITGDIVDNGALMIDHSNTFDLSAGVTGAGQVIQAGRGFTKIHRAETYSGGTIVENGVLSIDRAAAIGSGALDLFGGKLLSTQNTVLTNGLSMTGHFAIAASANTTLDLNSTTKWTLDDTGNAHIAFGDSSHSGTIVWHTPAGSGITGTGSYAVDVLNGTLIESGPALLTDAASVTVEAGAKLNINDASSGITNLHGKGSLTELAAAAQLSIFGGNFGGQLHGATDILVFDRVELTGSGDFTGEFKIEGTTARLDLFHAWSQDVLFESGGILALHTPALFTGAIQGFGASDLVDVRGVDFNSASFSKQYNATTGVLTLSDGSHTDNLTFAGSFVSDNFDAAPDGLGGTQVVFQAAPAQSDWF